MIVKKWHIQKEGGNSYVVSETSGGKFLCSCPVGKYRRTEDGANCKHVLAVKHYIRAGFSDEQILDVGATFYTITPVTEENITAPEAKSGAKQPKANPVEAIQEAALWRIE
jgi:hypothetical protein